MTKDSKSGDNVKDKVGADSWATNRIVSSTRRSLGRGFPVKGNVDPIRQITAWWERWVPLRGTELPREFLDGRVSWWPAHRLTRRCKPLYLRGVDRYGNRRVGVRVPGGVLVVAVGQPLHRVPMDVYL